MSAINAAVMATLRRLFPNRYGGPSPDEAKEPRAPTYHMVNLASLRPGIKYTFSGTWDAWFEGRRPNGKYAFNIPALYDEPHELNRGDVLKFVTLFY